MKLKYEKLGSFIQTLSVTEFRCKPLRKEGKGKKIETVNSNEEKKNIFLGFGKEATQSIKQDLQSYFGMQFISNFLGIKTNKSKCEANCRDFQSLPFLCSTKEIEMGKLSAISPW